MTQQKPNPEAPQPLSEHADVIQFRARSEEITQPTEQNSAQFYINKWIGLNETGQSLAQTILRDTDLAQEPQDERQRRFKAAVQSSPLYDNFDEMHQKDIVVNTIEMAFMRNVGEGLTPIRKAYLILMDVRAVDIVRVPDANVSEQLDKLPLGNEDTWILLIDKLSEQG